MRGYEPIRPMPSSLAVAVAALLAIAALLHLLTSATHPALDGEPANRPATTSLSTTDAANHEQEG